MPYIWNLMGNRMFPLNVFKEIAMLDETDKARQEHPSRRGECYVIRAYQEIGNDNTSVILASYETQDEAVRAYGLLADFVAAEGPLFGFNLLDLTSIPGPKGDPERAR